MRTCKLTALLIGLVVLAGCGSADKPAAESREAPAKQEGVFDDMTGTLDKAATVEDIAGSRKSQLDDAIEE